LSKEIGIVPIPVIDNITDNDDMALVIYIQ
jgi:hypothetical protein